MTKISMLFSTLALISVVPFDAHAQQCPLQAAAAARHATPVQSPEVVAVGTHAAALPADIVDTAVGAGSFNTLVAAVKAAGLVEALKSEGPFTVFAPSDEAFAQLPAEVVQDLLKPENKEKLAAILTYHVVPGKVMAADLVGYQQAKSLQGQNIAVTVADAAVMVDDAQVVKTDILCANGVIHVIDKVIMPK